MKNNINYKLAEWVKRKIIASDSLTSLWGIYQPQIPKDMINELKDVSTKNKFHIQGKDK